MNLDRTGGGLLTNGRTQREPQQVQPMRPQPKQTAPHQQPPQQPPQQMPQGAPQAMPQGAAPQGMPQQGMPPDAGMGPEGMPQEQGGVNDLANNALALMHDESFAPQVEQLIMQGEEGAADAAVLIGEQVIQAHQQRGMEPDPAQASDAIMEVIGDLGEIGIGMGVFSEEPMISIGQEGQQVPAAVLAVMSYASEKWAAKFPEFGQSLQQDVSEVTPQDNESARQLAMYMKQRTQQRDTGQPTPDANGRAINRTDGQQLSSPEPGRGYLG